MLRVTQSNRLEALADRLAAALDAAPAGPLVAEVVLVPNLGMARWLSLWIARAHGICANVRFELPAQFVWKVLGRVVGPRAEVDLFDPDVLTWRIFDVLGELGPEPELARLRAYVDAPSDRPRLELARRIAGVFDQYLVYRPEWIHRWEAGGDAHWQARLWRRLVATRREPHRVHLLDALVRALGRGDVPVASLPARVFAFGIPAMPPAYVAVLGHLGAHVDVDVLLVGPSPEHTSELVTPRELARRTRTLDAEAAHLEVGNRLLAGLGRQGAEFRDVLEAWNPHPVDAWVTPDETTILGAVQADVYYVRDRGSAAMPATLRADDGSIQVHACHGPMREVEVLHDQLLALFDRHRDLAPSDVVVMTPDVETYAPCVEAVFGTAPRERQIPYTIADRSLRAERPLVDAFVGLLELPRSRYDANRVLALLDVDAVRRRFGFEPTDVARARRWVREAGVRWGVDAAAREAIGLPPDGEHTWRFGLDRLLLGFAMAGEGRRSFGGVVPYDDVEGTAARVVGLLATFAGACVGLRDELGAPRSASDWVHTLGAVLDRFFDATGAEEEDAATVRRALVELERVAARAGFAGTVSLDVVRAHLEGALAAPLGSGRFLAGQVTFCALVPMRSIPFEVVCLLGMNDDGYPRPRRPIGFDLMADDFKPGDRSRREDDRYLFLEALLSARRVLYASYTGYDARDAAERLPSVLVADLVDIVRRGFGVDCTRRHPLQPFDARYFSGDPSLFSHAEELCRARQGQGSRAEREAPFLLAPLAEPDAAWRTVELDDLVHFFRGPARFFLRERLGVRLEAARGEVDTREPFVLDALERYRVRDELVRLVRAGGWVEALCPLLRGAGLLPHGIVGEVAFEGEARGVRGLVERVSELGGDGRPLPVEVVVDGFRVHGNLAPSREGGIVDFRPARVKPADRLGLWIRHVALACAGSGGPSRFVGIDREVALRAVADPRGVLSSLLALYWDGLQRPLPFFPRASWAAAGANDPLARARAEWVDKEGPRPLPGEGSDAYNALAFRGREALDEEFLRLAARVCGPLAQHTTEYPR